MEEITDSSFKKVFKGNVLVDFYADWCGPCKMMSPIIEELSKSNPKIKFYKLDVDKSGDAAMMSRVRSLPTIVLYKDGQEVNRYVGAVSKQELQNGLHKTY